MRRRLKNLYLLLFILPPAALGVEWVTVWVADSEDPSGWYSDWLVDVESLSGNEQARRAWVLINMKTTATVSSGNRRSIRMLWLIDCASDRFRRLTLSAYRGAMGTGAVITTDSRETTWDYPPPGTATQAVLNFVCSVESSSRSRELSRR